MRIDWELLLSYHSGTCTDAEREAFEAMLAESAEYRAAFDRVRQVGVRAGRNVAPAREAELAASLRRAMTERAPAIGTGRQGARPRRVPAFVPSRSRWRTAARAAAVVALVAGAGLLWRAETRSSEVPVTVTAADSAAGATEIHTPRGQRLTFRLSDSTLVTLAPMSRLRLAATYGARSRDVFLEGEASFTVTHDARRPFAVHTARAVARDLGTRFVVRAYAEDVTTDVVVAEGIVAVSGVKRATDSLVLTHGDLARLTPDGQWTQARGVSLDRYFAWTEGRLVFRDVALREAIVRLSRWYDIDIQLASAGIGARTLDASFRQESAPDAIAIVAAALNLDVTQTGRTYTLRAK